MISPKNENKKNKNWWRLKAKLELRRRLACPCCSTTSRRLSWQLSCSSKLWWSCCCYSYRCSLLLLSSRRVRCSCSWGSRRFSPTVGFARPREPRWRCLRCTRSLPLWWTLFAIRFDIPFNKTSLLLRKNHFSISRNQMISITCFVIVDAMNGLIMPVSVAIVLDMPNMMPL